jgi:N-acyl homoserine lactone hydrolase
MLLTASCAIPAAPPHANVPPQPRSPPMGLCWLEYVTDQQPAGYGLAGSSEATQWEVTFSGLLIRHPKGDVLIDAGPSTHFLDEIGTAGPLSRLLLRKFQGSGTVVASAPEALRKVGEEPSTLQAIVISHIHGDHAGGVMDLPGTPVVVSAAELTFLRAEKDAGNFDVIRAQAVAIDARARPIELTATPYENFDQSADYFGDGSIVFVPLAGHTPGSIGTFVSLSPTERYFHVGDAANTLEAVEKRRGKSFALELTDHDPARAKLVVAQLEQLHAQDPTLKILPAHDRRAWAAAFGAPGCLPPR